MDDLAIDYNGFKVPLREMVLKVWSLDGVSVSPEKLSGMQIP